MIAAIGKCVAKDLGGSHYGLSRVDMDAGQITVL